MNADTPESLRLFFALWPDDATRTALMQLQSTMHGRLVHYDNLHLTLAFLGQQPAVLLPDLKQILTRLTSVAITLSLDRIGYFARNRIAWAGMHHIPGALLTLQQEVTQRLQQNSISFNGQHGFKPHVTLARDASLPPDTPFTPIVWQANEIALVKSVTEAGGARYCILASRSLDAECWTKNEAAGDAAGSPY